jgi:pseudouridine-5'-phosphate glycosidase
VSWITVHPEVDHALRHRRPVVALETALMTHGLPRRPLAAGAGALPGGAEGWDREGPLNLETARAMQRTVREGGAVPATIGVLGGTLHIGLDEQPLAELASDRTAAKASTANLAAVMARGQSAGTAVSATLAACALAEAGPIRVFATGGIGGVHAGWTQRPDVSADLLQLATTPTCVVCAGAKSILDLPATVEALETLGVPVVGYRTDHFPRFHAPGDERLHTTHRVDDAPAVARLCRVQWEVLGAEVGVVLANPIPPQFALDGRELEEAVAKANLAADEQAISGAQRTPFLLAELARLTDERSLVANIALLLNNARLAAAAAVALSGP